MTPTSAPKRAAGPLLCTTPGSMGGMGACLLEPEPCGPSLCCPGWRLYRLGRLSYSHFYKKLKSREALRFMSTRSHGHNTSYPNGLRPQSP